MSKAKYKVEKKKLKEERKLEKEEFELEKKKLKEERMLLSEERKEFKCWFQSMKEQMTSMQQNVNPSKPPAVPSAAFNNYT